MKGTIFGETYLVVPSDVIKPGDMVHAVAVIMVIIALMASYTGTQRYVFMDNCARACGAIMVMNYLTNCTPLDISYLISIMWRN